MPNRRYLRRATTTIYLEDDQLKELRAIAKKTGRPMAHLIRRGIDLALIEAEMSMREVPDPKEWLGQ